MILSFSAMGNDVCLDYYLSHCSVVSSVTWSEADAKCVIYEGITSMPDLQSGMPLPYLAESNSIIRPLPPSSETVSRCVLYLSSRLLCSSLLFDTMSTWKQITIVSSIQWHGWWCSFSFPSALRVRCFSTHCYHDSLGTWIFVTSDVLVVLVFYECIENTTARENERRRRNANRWAPPLEPIDNDATSWKEILWSDCLGKKRFSFDLLVFCTSLFDTQLHNDMWPRLNKGRGQFLMPQGAFFMKKKSCPIPIYEWISSAMSFRFFDFSAKEKELIESWHLRSWESLVSGASVSLYEHFPHFIPTTGAAVGLQPFHLGQMIDSDDQHVEEPSCIRWTVRWQHGSR